MRGQALALNQYRKRVTINWWQFVSSSRRLPDSHLPTSTTEKDCTQVTSSTLFLLLATCTLVLGLAFLRELRLRRGLERLLRNFARGHTTDPQTKGPTE